MRRSKENRVEDRKKSSMKVESEYENSETHEVPDQSRDAHIDLIMF